MKTDLFQSQWVTGKSLATKYIIYNQFVKQVES